MGGFRSRRLPLPPVLAAGAILVQVVLTRRAGRRSVPASVMGGAVAVAGGLLAFAGHHEFTTVDTTSDPTRPQDASVLVTGGVFRHTRNPMYSGLALVLVGHALHRRDLRALFPVVAFCAILDRTQIPREESALTQRFPQAYAAYREKVRRWV